MKLFDQKIIKQNWTPLLIVIIAVAFILFIEGFDQKKLFRKFIDSEFSGKIWKIQTTVKGTPIVYITDDKYYLSYYGTDLRSYIQTGDSIKKEKGTGDIYVYRLINNSYVVHLFKNW